MSRDDRDVQTGAAVADRPVAAGLSERKKKLLELMLAERRAKAAAAERAAAPTAPATPQTTIPPFTGDAAPLSFTQERLWFIESLQEGGAAYNVPALVMLEGELDRHSLAGALAAVVERHAVLRTTFPARDGRPHQKVGAVAAVELPRVDLSDTTQDDQMARLQELARDFIRRPFDLATGPLLRVCLVRLAPRRHAVVLVIHHIVCDTWSINLLVRELGVLYASRLAGHPASLPPLPVAFADYAAWQRERAETRDLARELDFWKQRLEGMPQLLDLPTDRPRPAVQSPWGARHFWSLPKATVDSLKELGRRHRASLFMTLLAGFDALLARWSGQRDLVIGTPVANRVLPELEALVGPLLNTLLLRVDTAAEEGGDTATGPRFTTLLERARDAVADAFDHSELPFELLLQELSPERDLSRNPLFQVSLILQNAPRGELAVPGLSMRPLDVDAGTMQLDLTLQLTETEDGLSGWMEYDSDLFADATIGRLLAAYRRLLEAVARAPETRLAELPLASAEERRRLLVDWNDTTTELAPAGAPQTLPERFAAQARRTPEATALRFEGEAMTYGELDAVSAALARRLVDRGVLPGDVVGLAAERGFAMLVGLYAIHRAGAAYLPLDPSLPEERLGFMLEDGLAGLAPAARAGRSGVVLAEPHLADRLPEGGHTVVELEPEAWAPGDGDTAGLPEITADHPAYVIYTSGSTGRPKGVVVAHRQILNRLDWMQGAYGLTADDRVLQKTTYAFDVSVWELFWPLITGATLVLARPGAQGDAEHLVSLIAEEGVTVMHFVPSMLRAFLEVPGLEELDTLRWVLASGEALPYDLEQRFLARSCATLVNQYGPTEAAVDVTAWFCRPADEPRPVPIGQPGGNTRLYVVDSRLQPVPGGVRGELLIGGAQVAVGYLGRPALTAERFVPDPFSGESVPAQPGARLYRTGDEVRLQGDPAGDLEELDLVFLRRLDHQVKVRGFRIELGEIEAALSRQPAVRDVAVVTWEAAPGDVRLAAYLVADEAALEAAGGVDGLRTALGRELPEYMVPAAFLVLDELPSTASGKLDRRALPSPEGALSTGTPYRAPSTEVEEALVEIWSGLLGLPAAGDAEAAEAAEAVGDAPRPLGVDDPLFELGAHSLLVTQALSRLRDRFGVELPLAAVFETPTVAGLAARVDTVRGGDGDTAAGHAPLPKVTPVSRDGELPLSFSQERMWFIQRMTPGLSAYNAPGAVALTGRLDRGVLRRALEEILRRHEVLRTSFPEVSGEPVQVIAPPGPFALPLIDLSDLGPEAAREHALEIARREARRPFDLAVGPLLRARLLRLAGDEHLLDMTLHHVVYDMWAREVFIRELAALYDAFHRGAPSPLPEPEIQYADFAAWQRRVLQGEVLEVEVAWWRDALEGAPPAVELMPDRSRPPVQTFRGDRVYFDVPPAVAEKITALAQRETATVYMVLLAGFKALLSRYTALSGIVVGTPIANRNRAEVEGIIGFLANILVLHTDLGGDPTFRQILARVRETTLGAFAHQDLPFERLVGELAPVRDLSRQPVFQVMFNYLQDYGSLTIELPEVTLSVQEVHNGGSTYDLSVHTWGTGDAFRGAADFNTDLFDRATIERFTAHFTALLEAAVETPGTRLGDLPILSADERHELLVEWNDTAAELAPAGAPETLPERFAAQARRTPEATALCFEGEAMTYGELDAASAALARRLVARGVLPGDVVGLAAERGFAMLVGLYAIHRAGAAYLPLDPSLPEERLGFMLEDGLAGLAPAARAGRPGVVLAEPHLADRLPEADHTVVQLEPEAWAPGEGDTAGLPEITADHPAYVIYTSGSTGRPKGVVIAHHQILNRLDWMQGAYGLTADDRVLQKTTYAFDVSVWELFWPLITGATLVLARPGGQGDADYLVRLIADEGVTVVHFVPSMLRLFLEAPGLEDLDSLRWVLASGEALPHDLEQRFLQRSGATLVNQYGPTEAAVDVTAWFCRPADEPRPVPIGRPGGNTRLYVVDRRLRPVPAGVRGELLIGGAQVAVGYLGRPALTAERFVPDPFSGASDPAQPGARLYRTGDEVRHQGDPAGDLDELDLVFLRRLDHQVKVRGFRVELGEIEAALSRQPAVRDVAVVTWEATPGDVRLAAYVVADEAALEAVGGVDGLRTALGRELPEHMVPAAFLVLDELPLTASGKLDRRALPPPDPSLLGAAAEHVEPETETERELAGIWRQLLGVERVGLNDNFFFLGGHSLLATRVLYRVRERMGVELPLVVFFEGATLGELARAVDVARWAAEDEPPVADAAGFEMGEL